MRTRRSTHAEQPVGRQLMDLSRNDDMPNPVQHSGWIRLAGHSALRLSPGLRPPPLCRCAERPTNLIPGAVLARQPRKPRTLVADGAGVSGAAKSRGRPQGGGHSRSQSPRRRWPTGVCCRPWGQNSSLTSAPSGHRRSSLSSQLAKASGIGWNGVVNFGTLNQRHTSPESGRCTAHAPPGCGRRGNTRRSGAPWPPRQAPG